MLLVSDIPSRNQMNAALYDSCRAIRTVCDPSPYLHLIASRNRFFVF